MLTTMLTIILLSFAGLCLALYGAAFLKEMN